MFVMKSLPILLIANFIYGCVVVVSSANFGTSRSSPSSSSSAKLQIDRALPPLVPPKLVEDDDDFDERDLDLSAADHHGLQLRPPYWAPTLETLAPEEAEFYRKALVSAMIGSRPAAAAAAVHEMKRGAEAGHRSMSMLRMGRGSSGVRRRSATMGSDGVRRSMTMLRMGRGFDEEEGEEEENAVKRTMGMLRMGRGANGEEDFRKSMSMLRMGRGAMLNEDEDEEESEDQHQQQLKRSMGMLRMGRRNLGSSSSSSDDGDALDRYEDVEDGESKRSMGMLRMGRAMASKNVDRGALNMLRMGKREIISSSSSHHQLTGSASSAAAADKSSSSSN